MLGLPWSDQILHPLIFIYMGIDQYNPALDKYICIAAVAAHIPDAVLGELLQDDRVALHHDHIKAEMHAEVAWLQRLPSSFWTRLSSVAACTPSELQHDAMQATLVSLALPESEPLETPSLLALVFMQRRQRGQIACSSSWRR